MNFLCILITIFTFLFDASLQISQGNSTEHIAMSNALVYKKNNSHLIVTTDCIASYRYNCKSEDGN